MHPAPSVIIFTTLSGIGFGMLAWLGIDVLNLHYMPEIVDFGG